MRESPSHGAIPEHIAIIMDGNGRWARQQGKPRTFGHQAGFKATRKTVENCVELGVKSLTLYAFSSENWRRPEQEVGVLMDLFMRALKSEVKQLDENGVRIRFIGDLSAFSEKLRYQMGVAIETTKNNSTLNLSIAVNYGGRWDIINAARKLAEQVRGGNLTVEQIDEASFAQYVCLNDLPNPDLLIRTSGEIRLSNYLLWQLAYTEFYFTEILWPDFDKSQLQAAIDWFKQCERRYGQTTEQLVTS